MAIFTAIGSAIAGIGAWLGASAIGTFVLRTAVGLGINLLAQAIAGKPKEAVFSLNGTLQAGGDVPRSFVLGRTNTAGSLVWSNTWGQSGDTPNAHLTQVIALSDLPIQGVEQLWVNGELCTLDATTGPNGRAVLEYRRDGVDHMWFRFYDGTQTSADPLLTGVASNAQRQWPATRVGRGVAYVVMTSKVDKNLFSGIPSFKFTVVGPRLYDPSRDSTVPGGSGPHRLHDSSTWGGDGDHLPVVQLYNLLMGIHYSGQWFYGLQGMSANRLPPTNWIAQIAKCRASSGGEPTYRSGGEIPVDAPLASAIEAILTTCQGRISEVGGFYSVFVGEPDAPIADFHDDQILSTEEQSFSPFFGLADTINGISAKYPSPADGWAVKTAPPLYRTDLEAQVGNRRLMADVNLDFVPYPEQVQRLMKSALAEGQRARRHTIVLPPAFWRFAYPGAVWRWTSARNGYVVKHFRVDGVIDRANLDVMVDITEVDPSDFDWNPATDYRPPVDGAIGVIRPPAQPLVGWQVFPATIGPPGRELPSIRVAFPGRLVDVRAVRVQVRLAGGTDVMFDGEVPYGDPNTNDVQESVILSGSFSPDTDYEVRGILVPDGAREVDWSEWLFVKTPDVWISDVYDVDLDALGDDVRAALEWAGNGLREVEQRLEELDTLLSDQGLVNTYNHQSLRQQLTATFGEARAQWTLDVQVVATATTALAVRVEELDAEVFDPATGLPAVANAVDALQTEVGLIDGELSAMAQAITSLSASTTPGVVSEANFRMQAVAGPAGSTTIAAQTRQGGSGDWRGAAWYLRTPNNPALPTEFVVDAQQMVFGDVSSGSYINPLIYSGGVWRMNVANIGTVTSGVIKSPDDKFIINLAAGSIEWFD